MLGNDEIGNNFNLSWLKSHCASTWKLYQSADSSPSLSDLNCARSESSGLRTPSSLVSMTPLLSSESIKWPLLSSSCRWPFSFPLDDGFSSFTLSAYLMVFRECSQQLKVGDTIAIYRNIRSLSQKYDVIIYWYLWFIIHNNSLLTMQVLDFSPMNESRRTWVNLDALNGKWLPLRPKARMHSLSASNDLFISAPSMP